MGKAGREQLNRALSEHLNTIHETLQMLDQTPSSSLEKVSWKDVIQMAEQVSKHATTVGMLYTGESSGVKALEENMTAYFNMLQGFVLLSHGSLIGAGPTLSSCIHKTVKQVVDSSFMLLQEAVSSYGSPNKAQKHSIPQLVGAVWEACSSVKKTPTSNIIAIGRAMTQVAVSMKDVLREIKELKPASSDATDEASGEISTKVEDTSSDGNDSCGGDLGNDLSPKEMKIAQLATNIVSATLAVVKELIRSITALLQRETSDSSGVSVDSLEELLELCRGFGIQVDELGACLYPPQEISAIKVVLERILSFTKETEIELQKLKGMTEGFSKACSGLRSALGQLESELCSEGTGDPVPELGSLVLCN